MSTTIKESVSAIDSLLNQFADSKPVSPSLCVTACEGISKNIQVRDYLLGAVGLTLTDPMDGVKFLECLDFYGENSANLYAVAGAYAYESGDLKKCQDFLTCANELENGHSLTNLLARCIMAGFPQNAFQALRAELHTKVIDQLNEVSSEVVGAE